MKFHKWQTMVQEHVKSDKSLRKKSRQELWQLEAKALMEFPFKNTNNRNKRLYRFGAETEWEHEGCPYYNIHPLMVEKLIQANLDNIPSKFIELPFRTICFRFASDIPTRYTEGGVTLVQEEGINSDPIYTRSVLFTKFSKEEQQIAAKEVETSKFQSGLLNEDAFLLFADEGFRQKIDGVERLLCNTITLYVRDDETIPEAITRAIAEESEDTERIVLKTMKHRLENLFRVIISAGFLANAPEENLVVPDILNKDKRKYDEAVANGDKKKIQEIVERAHRRGHKGWNIGTNEIFVGEHVSDNQPASDSTGRELLHSHIRSGHPHAVRYGPGKKLVKIKWFRPTRVRKDLPFKVD